MKEVVQSFYDAFVVKDGEKMASCYHSDIVFEDPAFGELKGDRAGDMWRMLCERGKDLKITYEIESVTEDSASVHWVADYSFGKDKRPVHNQIKADLRFKDGLIIDHRDQFDLHRWASQALGWKGKLLGGTAFIRNQIRKQSNQALDRYVMKKS